MRYRQADQDCRVRRLDGGLLEVQFDQDQRAVAPGQYVVFYDPAGQRCLGGAVIDTLIPAIGQEENRRSASI